jgi:hypothetical protein
MSLLLYILNVELFDQIYCFPYIGLVSKAYLNETYFNVVKVLEIQQLISGERSDAIDLMNGLPQLLCLARKN